MTPLERVADKGLCACVVTSPSQRLRAVAQVGTWTELLRRCATTPTPHPSPAAAADNGDAPRLRTWSSAHLRECQPLLSIQYRSRSADPRGGHHGPVAAQHVESARLCSSHPDQTTSSGDRAGAPVAPPRAAAAADDPGSRAAAAARQRGVQRGVPRRAAPAGILVRPRPVHAPRGRRGVRCRCFAARPAGTAAQHGRPAGGGASFRSAAEAGAARQCVRAFRAGGLPQVHGLLWARGCTELHHRPACSHLLRTAISIVRRLTLGVTTLSLREGLAHGAVHICLPCRHYGDLAHMTDDAQTAHYIANGIAEHRVARRLRVVAAYEAAAGRDLTVLYGGLCNQLYSHVDMLAVLILMGAEVVRCLLRCPM